MITLETTRIRIARELYLRLFTFHLPFHQKDKRSRKLKYQEEHPRHQKYAHLKHGSLQPDLTEENAMKKVLIFIFFALFIFALFLLSAQGKTNRTFSPYVDADGNIRVPMNYRTEWAFLGTWAVASKQEKGRIEEFHNVYTQPGTIEAHRKTGMFPDGAVLVKELLKTKTGAMTTGEVSWGTEIAGWFVVVKDSQNRFKGNPLWGDGWGWALFNADSPTNTVTKDYKKDCIPCHLPAKKTDWAYVQGYPVLAMNSKSTDLQKPDMQSGADVFNAHCATCHEDGGNRLKPDKTLKLQDLKQNGMDTLEAVTSQVKNGTPPMPAFKNILNETQIKTVSAFVLEQAKKGW
jgi:mono/diheme cytochrome c family protein